MGGMGEREREREKKDTNERAVGAKRKETEIIQIWKSIRSSFFPISPTHTPHHKRTTPHNNNNNQQQQEEEKERENLEEEEERKKSNRKKVFFCCLSLKRKSHEATPQKKNTKKMSNLTKQMKLHSYARPQSEVGSGRSEAHTLEWYFVEQGYTPARHGHSAVPYGTGIYVFGGDGKDNRRLNAIHRFFFCCCSIRSNFPLSLSLPF